MSEIENLYNQLAQAEPRLRVMMYSNLESGIKEKLNLFSSIQILEGNHTFYSKHSNYRPELRKMYEDKIKLLKSKLYGQSN